MRAGLIAMVAMVAMMAMAVIAGVVARKLPQAPQLQRPNAKYPTNSMLLACQIRKQSPRKLQCDQNFKIQTGEK
jgi:hypothetical protein